MSKFYKQIFCDGDLKYSVVIEDNGRVAYAYLLYEKEIIADVWLYNSQAAPEQAPWLTEKDMPYENPKEFVKVDATINPIKIDDDVEMECSFENSKLHSVYILIRKEKIAMMKPGSKPGWSTLASIDGPLAKVMK